MNYVKSLVVGSLGFAVTALVFGVEVVPLYDSTLLTFVMSAFTAGILGTVNALVAAVLFGILFTLILADSGVGAAVGVIIWFVTSLFYWPFVMTALVPNWIDWFPQFTYWQYFAMSLVVMVIELLTNESTKKENK